MFDIHTFVRDYRLPVAGPGDSHHRNNWVSMRCLFCDDRHAHLGFSLTKGYFSCFRCGKRSIAAVVKKVTGLYGSELNDLLERYRVHEERPESLTPAATRTFAELPFGCGPMMEMHRKYLRERNYDPEKMEKVWGLQGTGNVGEQRFRIVVPFRIQKRIVSWTARTIGKMEPRYFACPREMEAVWHKELVLGADEVPHDTCVIVEGAFDMMRMGPGAVATCGTGWTHAQAAYVASRFNRARILYDNEPEAQESARKLCLALQTLGVETAIVEPFFPEGTDPGALDQATANEAMETLLR